MSSVAYNPLREPKEITVDTQSGETRTYIISKFPAIAGREIIAKYPLTAIPRLAEYSSNEEVMMKLMAYVAVPPSVSGAPPITLSTRALVENHVPDWETLGRIELATMEYNCSFFLAGKISTFFGDISQKLPALITKILTDSLGQLSTQTKPPSTNSEQSIP